MVREGRHPFLDEAFVHHVLQLPVWCVADLRRPAGEGDKVLLRGMLRVLGLPRCGRGVGERVKRVHRAASRVKRAIQFGTRLANQCNRRDFGSNRAANTQQAGSKKVIL